MLAFSQNGANPIASKRKLADPSLPEPEWLRLKNLVALAFFSKQIAEPIGRFTYFDVNPRNQSA